MTVRPAGPGGTRGWHALLFTPGGRLGWRFRDRRELAAPYPEPEPDADTIRRQVTVRAQAAGKSYERARKWAARPSLMLAVLLLALAGCARALNPGTHTMTTVIAAVVLCGPGVALTAWLRRQLTVAKAADPEREYRQALEAWQERAAGFEEAELGRLSHLPEWGSVPRPAARLDVFGGTLAGWQSLLAVHGTSILAGQPLLVADLTGQRAADHLTALARQAGISGASYLLPEDLDASGLLTRLNPGQLAGALAEAIHAGTGSGARSDRAIDVRVLEQIADVLGGHVTLSRLAGAARAALGQPVPPGLLTGPEQEVISGPLFPDSYRTQVAGSLVRLDAFLSDLASWTGSGPVVVPPPAWYTCLAVSPSAISARSEVLTSLLIQWLTLQVTGSTARTPAVILAGPDDITRAHLERLAAACERNRVPLTVLFRHLRDDALGFLGGGATAFMRLGNHAEAEQAASYIGRHHTFAVSQFTATRGGSQATTHADTYGWGTSESLGSNVTHGWNDERLGAYSTSGSRTSSRDRSTSRNWSQSTSWADGTSWSDAVGVQRVYEYAVEPSVLQSLPDNVLLVPAQAGQVQVVECDPEIVTLPHVSAMPLDQAVPRGWGQPGEVLSDRRSPPGPSNRDGHSNQATLSQCGEPGTPWPEPEEGRHPRS